jgi:hypothetical protein
MALSRLARELAAEIAFHDWSDAPYRVDRAGHRRESDTGPKRSRNVLEADQEQRVRCNVAFVTGQVLGHAGLIDPRDIGDWMAACGVNVRVGSKIKAVPAFVHMGFRWTEENEFAEPMLAQRERDRELGIKMSRPEPWDEIDFDDDTLIELNPVAAYAVQSWLDARGVPKRIDRDSLAAHLRRVQPCVYEDEEDETSARWITLGNLRWWFVYRYMADKQELPF